ncbi:Aquaporin-like protein [Pseudocohnilembus persalinus]|uniref:Aquaporin-like protein n=1 Tax=Pseudocohnilembus persalinus TaxID=266149 RepID=A0A0V0R6L5_PSEPJ|nr:Aquaporin-like protein [Pseudocohnilembus persalinus]|eukprot:KRX10121.1 Aquaporin-like protein [Pseudocohnilembus persalinus]
MNKEISNKENDNFITIRGIRFQIPQTKNPITNWRKTKILAWELLGTAVFTYGICQATTPYYVSLSLFAGLLLTAPISGGHLNSGVSLGFFIKGDIPILELLFRMIGQFRIFLCLRRWRNYARCIWNFPRFVG